MSTLLSYTKSAFVAFTKIVAADMNQYFTDLKSRINWAGGTDTATGLGDDNIQSNAAAGGGLTRSTKLKAGTANYVVINDGSGNMTEEQYLAVSRGGAGQSLSSAVSGDAPIYNGSTFAPSGPIPAGVTFPYVGTTAPSGYLLCDGSPVSRTTYSRLFAIIGSTYGQGDGSTTFNVPDMRGLFVRGAAQWISDTFTASSSSGLLLTTTAGRVTRSGQQIQVSSGGSLPTGLSASTTYFTIYVSSTTFRVATTYANALSGTAIAYTNAGTGTHTVYNWADPDLANRAQFTAGSTSTTSSPGTWQTDSFTDHTHTTGAYGGSLITGAGAPQGNASAQTYTVTSSGATNLSGQSQTTHTTETRPFNLAFTYIIKT